MRAVSKARPAEQPVPDMPRFAAEATGGPVTLPRVSLVPWQESVQNAESQMGPSPDDRASQRSAPAGPGRPFSRDPSLGAARGAAEPAAAATARSTPSAVSAPAFFSPSQARQSGRTRNFGPGAKSADVDASSELEGAKSLYAIESISSRAACFSPARQAIHLLEQEEKRRREQFDAMCVKRLEEVSP